MMRKVLAWSGLCLFAAACGNRSLLGSGEGDAGIAGSGGNSGSAGSGAAGTSGSSGTSGTAGSAGVSGSGGSSWQPCAGKPCGAECSLCGPNDPNCSETGVLKYCDQSGSCGQAYPVCDVQK